jgi:CRP-like cAMP-binding protein
MYTQLKTAVARHITLSDSDFEHFSSYFTLKKLRKRQYLLQQGDICRHLYYVNKGCLRSFEVDNADKEHILQFSVEDWWVGDMVSSLTQTPSQINIECLENCEILQIEQVALEKLYFEIPQLERFFRIITQNAYIAAQRRLLAVMSKPALERYLDFADRNPHIMQRVPNHLVASYLGITPESLSRLKKEYSIQQRSVKK